jgi:hypothetical protein
MQITLREGIEFLSMEKTLMAELSNDLMLGAEAIGEHLGLTPRQAFHMLETKKIPGFKLGNKWAARKSTLNDHITRLEQAANSQVA